MRVIVVSAGESGSDDQIPDDADSRVDAQIRVGGDAGASEVLVVRAYGGAATDQESLVTGLLLPDAPVVAWWPADCPSSVSQSAIGRIAQRRITDAAAHSDPLDALRRVLRSYQPGDTDFAWTRLTLWRAQLAAVLDQPPYSPVTAVDVSGASDSASVVLLAAWLRLRLQVDVKLDLTTATQGRTGIASVALHRSTGTIRLERTQSNIAILTQPNQPIHDLSLPRRNLRDCLAEELRRLDPDDLFGDVLKNWGEQ